MIIVVHNECHFYSNVLDYLNNFIIITISQDNYFRPPPPLIETSFLDDEERKVGIELTHGGYESL